MGKLLLGMAVLAAFITTTAKAETTNCKEIVSVPVIISTNGVHCFKGNLRSNNTSGNIIEITSNNVTIDMNGFKLRGLGAGPGTTAVGIAADGRKNIAIRNGTIRGFQAGIYLSGGNSSGHLLENLLLDRNTSYGLWMEGTEHVVRNNRVKQTGPHPSGSQAIGIRFVNTKNSVIANNTISRVVSDAFAVGIWVRSSSIVKVVDNTVFDVTMDAATDANIHGIRIQEFSDKVNVVNNTLIKNDVGTTGAEFGISNGSAPTTEINCIGNTIVGFAAHIRIDGQSGSTCDNEIGNNLL